MPRSVASNGNLPSRNDASQLRGRDEPSARRLRIALAQINVTVGDFAGNVRRVSDAIRQAAQAGSQLTAFPELALPGYPPEDLLLKPDFINDNLRALEDLAQLSADFPAMTIVVGFADRHEDLYNAASIVQGGEVKGVYHKHFLPNYGVFDEDRYFSAGRETPTWSIGGVRVGISICEDIWYPDGPAAQQALAGAELLLNISASPFYVGKQGARERMLATRAADSSAIVAYLNLVGGQDELVFDGSSVVFDEEGELIARARAFAEDLLVVDLDVDAVFRTRLHDPRVRKALAEAQPNEPRIFISGAPDADAVHVPKHLPRASEIHPGTAGRIEPPPTGVEGAYRALVMGLHDYVAKNGFHDVVIGLSGGIDSALTAVIAADALGAEHVHGVSLPSRYSSEGSRDDARSLAANLGINYLTIPIEQAFTSMVSTLAETLASGPPATAELTGENLQARIRANLWMALSNRFGWLVLATGNKSEMAVGYATLYGDMAGGFAPLKDVSKTLVYALARWRNTQGAQPVIPASTLEKPPSAELRPNQRDTDSLPPYDILDPILRAYVEEDRSYNEIVALGFAPGVVGGVLAMVDRSEYKRRQAAPGIKITTRAFGRDRRLPLTSAVRSQPDRRSSPRDLYPTRQ